MAKHARIKRMAQGLMMLLLVAWIAAFTFNTIVLDRAKPMIRTPAQINPTAGADAILVLGARVYGNGTLSPILQDRVELALHLYRSGIAPKLLFSGDHGQSHYDEVNAMRLFAESQEIPASDIFMDHAGFSTYESLYRARDIFGVRKLVIVTQQFHLSRAVYIAAQLGMEAHGVPSDPRRYAGASLQAFREFFARSKDFLYVHLFRPAPTYLGEPISIRGDGRVTHDMA